MTDNLRDNHMSDLRNRVAIVAFPDVWASVKNLFVVGAPVACRVKKLESGCSLVSVERLDLLWSREGLG